MTGNVRRLNPAEEAAIRERVYVGDLWLSDAEALVTEVDRLRDELAKAQKSLAAVFMAGFEKERMP